MTQPPSLKRSLTLPLMILYGLGTTIGAGIYALIGKVAEAAGAFAPTSFLVASLLAGFSAFSFAELVARYPSSAGEARYVREGLRSRSLSVAVGFLVIAAGTVSAAAIANGFAGYLQEFVNLPRPIVVAAVVVLLGLIAAWGIRESVMTAGVITLVEAGGLLLVIWAGRGAVAQSPPGFTDLVPLGELAVWPGILGGSLLAFFAFIGFEDMVNVAEEVKNVRRTLPIAIILTLVITLLFYVVLAVVAVRAVPLDELAKSQAPLALVYERGTGGDSSAIISVIGLIAMVNGALIQVIMASRVLYGMSSQNLLPRALGRIHPRTRTPLIATVLVTGVILVLGTGVTIAPLAEATSVITLVIFAFVNLALLFVKRREPRPEGIRVFPFWVPLIGFLVSTGFVAGEAIRFIAG